MNPETADGSEPSDVRQLTATLRRVLAVAGLLAVVALVVPFVIFAVPQVVGADHGFVILSGSMEPAISPGDVVIVDASAAVGVGDVVTFDDGKQVPTTHRVIGEEGGEYVTKGDANENADGRTVPADAVLGAVTLTIPLIGYVILWVNTPTGYVALVLVPIALLLGTELVSWARAGDETTGAGPTPAIRRLDAGATASADEPARDGTTTRSGVPVQDLLLTTLASAALVGYAGWNLAAELAVAGAPSPVTVTALTAGLFGLAAGLWMTVSVRLAARRATTAARDPPASSAVARPDGGTAEEVER